MNQTLFNPQAAAQIVARFEKLTPAHSRQWGQMEIEQMLAHTANVLEAAVGDRKPPRSLIGKLIGGFLKSKLTDPKPNPQNAPTDANFKITDQRQFEQEQKRVLALIKRFSEGGLSKVTRHPHPFFGKLTPEQWGMGQWKHLDHHLRQFGA